MERLKKAWSSIDLWKRYLIVWLVGTFTIVMTGGLLTAALAGDPHSDPEFCGIALEGCEANLQVDSVQAKHYRAEVERLRDEHRKELAERERTWNSIYEDVRSKQAGVECWARVVELEQQLDDEMKFYHWRLKSCGAIREKTKGAVKRYERQVDALLSESEEAKLDE
jgi:hypothetical protein